MIQVSKVPTQGKAKSRFGSPMREDVMAQVVVEWELKTVRRFGVESLGSRQQRSLIEFGEEMKRNLQRPKYFPTKIFGLLARQSVNFGLGEIASLGYDLLAKCTLPSNL